MSVKERFQLKKFSYHGQLSVVVIDSGSDLPALLPLLYLHSWGLSKAINTVKQHLVSVCQWYNYWHEKHQKSFDEAIFDNNLTRIRELVPLLALDSALIDYSGFATYVDSGRNQVDANWNEDLPPEPAIADATRDVRLGCVTQFLLFLARRYVSSRYTQLNSREQRTTLDSYRFRLHATRREACGL